LSCQITIVTQTVSLRSRSNPVRCDFVSLSRAGSLAALLRTSGRSGLRRSGRSRRRRGRSGRSRRHWCGGRFRRSRLQNRVGTRYAWKRKHQRKKHKAGGSADRYLRKNTCGPPRTKRRARYATRKQIAGARLTRLQ
jgi:hypothetical protein